MPHLQQSKSDATFAAVLVGQPIAHLVHVGHDGVGRVAHDGTEHSGDVTWQEVKEISGVQLSEVQEAVRTLRKLKGAATCGECDDELLALAALGPGLGHDVGVDRLDGALEAGELHHGVGDLAAPQRNQRLVETVEALLGV